MAEDKITPEEKLLKIIEGPVREKRPGGALKQPQAAARSLINRFKTIRVNKDVLKKINLNTVNKIAVSFCGLFTIFLMFDLTRSGFMVGRRFENLKQAAEASALKENIAPALDMDINNIFSNAGGRNMFTASPRGAEAEAVSAESAMQMPAVKVVGIIWSDNPQVMFEDAKEQKTYLLSAGDKIGGLTIKSILQDKVIVTDGKTERELR